MCTLAGVAVSDVLGYKAFYALPVVLLLKEFIRLSSSWVGRRRLVVSLSHEVYTYVIDVWHYEAAPIEQQAVLYSAAIGPGGRELSKAS